MISLIYSALVLLLFPLSAQATTPFDGEYGGWEPGPLNETPSRTDLLLTAKSPYPSWRPYLGRILVNYRSDSHSLERLYYSDNELRYLHFDTEDFLDPSAVLIRMLDAEETQWLSEATSNNEALMIRVRFEILRTLFEKISTYNVSENSLDLELNFRSCLVGPSVRLRLNLRYSAPKETYELKLEGKTIEIFELSVDPSKFTPGVTCLQADLSNLESGILRIK